MSANTLILIQLIDKSLAPEPSPLDPYELQETPSSIIYWPPTEHSRHPPYIDIVPLRFAHHKRPVPPTFNKTILGQTFIFPYGFSQYDMYFFCLRYLY